MKIDAVRRFALSLPEVTEEPHFDLSSFRVKGKIFATVPPGNAHLHLFVGDEEIELMPTVRPNAYEKLLWGKRIAGLRVTLAEATANEVRQLLRSAWRRKAPKKLAAALADE
jgi:hypothetical protein